MAKFREPLPTSREEASLAFETGDKEQMCDALVSIALHDPDWRWVQSWCLKLAGHENAEMRRLALTCFGHIARIHRQLDLDLVLPVIERMRSDPEVGGSAQDAMDDIAMFLGP